MTSYEKTRIFSDYLEALNSKTPKAVKDTIVKLAATLFEAAEATVDPSEVAEDPNKLADYLGIDRLVDQIVSNPSDRSVKSVQDTVASKIDALSDIYTNYEDVGLTQSVDKVYRAVLRAKKDPAEIDAAKQEVASKLATIEKTHPSLDTDGIMAGIDDVIQCAMSGNMNDFQAKRQDVDNRLASIESGYTGINNIDAAPAIDALTKVLEDRGLIQVDSKTKSAYRDVEQSQLMPKVQAWVNCIRKKIADDKQFETTYNNLVSNITDIVETTQQEHPELDASGLLSEIQSAKDLVQSNEKYDSLKGSIDTQVMKIDSMNAPKNDLGVDMNSIRANIEKAVAADPSSPEYQSAHDALASDINVLETKYTGIGQTLSEDLMSNIDIVIEKGRSNDPGYDAAFNYVNNQLSRIFTEISKATGSDDAGQVSPLKSTVASLFELLDKQLSSNQGFKLSQDRLATECTKNCPDNNLVDVINAASNLANKREFSEDLEGMLYDVVESTKDLDASKVNQMHNMDTKLSIMGRRNDIGAKIRQAFARLYNLGASQSDLATRERETAETRDQQSQVNQILGIDEMFNSLGKVPASELQAKFKERLEQLRQTMPAEQIDVSSIGDKIESEKQALNIELVQANDKANKARETFNQAQRTLDETVPENWDKLDELRKEARAAQKDVVDIKKKLTTLATAFDMAEFNRLVSEEKTTSRSLKLNTREDELRKGREAYNLSQHKDNGASDDAIDPSLLVSAPAHSFEERQAFASSLQTTFSKMLLVPTVREAYNNAIAGLKGAFAERRRMKEADPSADVSGVLAANYANGSLVQSEEGPWSCVEIAARGRTALPFPVYPFTELFGANPKAVISVAGDGTALVIKERELTLASGAKRPGSWEINVRTDDLDVVIYTSVPNDPDNPADGYTMELADNISLDEMRGSGAKTALLSYALEKLVSGNPKMQV